MKIPGLNQLRAELARNPRLRVGIVLIGALLLVYQLAGLADTRARLDADYSAKSRQLVRVQGISREDGWDRRASDIHAVRKALEAEIPDADSVGLAQATVQGWLRDTASHFGPKLTVTMGTPLRVDDQHPYWKIPVQINGPIAPSQALELIRQIESRKELITVESIRLTSGDNPSLALEVAGYYRVTKGGGVHAAP
ncbi:MAG: hypothetical protein ACYCZD_03520 [Rhodanobacter sp.]